jgi:hypothetical protein
MENKINQILNSPFNKITFEAMKSILVPLFNWRRKLKTPTRAFSCQPPTIKNIKNIKNIKTLKPALVCDKFGV